MGARPIRRPWRSDWDVALRVFCQFPTARSYFVLWRAKTRPCDGPAHRVKALLLRGFLSRGSDVTRDLRVCFLGASKVSRSCARLSPGRMDKPAFPAPVATAAGVPRARGCVYAHDTAGEIRRGGHCGHWTLRTCPRMSACPTADILADIHPPIGGMSAMSAGPSENSTSVTAISTPNHPECRRDSRPLPPPAWPARE
jgi:hypothetical protein